MEINNKLAFDEFLAEMKSEKEYHEMYDEIKLEKLLKNNNITK